MPRKLTLPARQRPVRPAAGHGPADQGPRPGDLEVKSGILSAPRGHREVGGWWYRSVRGGVGQALGQALGGTVGAEVAWQFRFGGAV